MLRCGWVKVALNYVPMLHLPTLTQLQSLTPANFGPLAVTEATKLLFGFVLLHSALYLAFSYCPKLTRTSSKSVKECYVGRVESAVVQRDLSGGISNLSCRRSSN